MLEPRNATIDFLILGCQRSGTTVTREAVQGHPQVSMLREELAVDPLFSRGFSAFTHGREPYHERRSGSRALFQALARLYSQPSTRAAGVKLAIPKVEHAARLRNFIIEFLPDVKIIHVRRSDLVSQFASWERARSTGVWDSFGGARAGGDGDMMSLDVARFESYAREMLEIDAVLASLRDHVSVLSFAYEADINVPHPRWERLYEFLGLDALEATWLRMQKIAPPVEAFVANVPELRAAHEKIAGPSPDAVQAAAVSAFDVSADRDSIEVLACRARAFRVSGWHTGAQRASQRASDMAPRAGAPREAVDILLREVMSRSLVPAREFDAAGFELMDRYAAPLAALHAGRLAELAQLALDLGDAVAADALCATALAEASGGRGMRVAAYAVLAKAIQTHGYVARVDVLGDRLAARCSEECEFWVIRSRGAAVAGRPADAEQYIMRARELDPGHPWLRGSP